MRICPYPDRGEPYPGMLDIAADLFQRRRQVPGGVELAAQVESHAVDAAFPGMGDRVVVGIGGQKHRTAERPQHAGQLEQPPPWNVPRCALDGEDQETPQHFVGPLKQIEDARPRSAHAEVFEMKRDIHEDAEPVGEQIVQVAQGVVQGSAIQFRDPVRIGVPAG
jgi:hypothetical protein